MAKRTDLVCIHFDKNLLVIEVYCTYWFMVLPLACRPVCLYIKSRIVIEVITGNKLRSIIFTFPVDYRAVGKIRTKVSIWGICVNPFCRVQIFTGLRILLFPQQIPSHAVQCQIGLSAFLLLICCDLFCCWQHIAFLCLICKLAECLHAVVREFIDCAIFVDFIFLFCILLPIWNLISDSHILLGWHNDDLLTLYLEEDLRRLSTVLVLWVFVSDCQTVQTCPFESIQWAVINICHSQVIFNIKLVKICVLSLLFVPFLEIRLIIFQCRKTPPVFQRIICRFNGQCRVKFTLFIQLVNFCFLVRCAVFEECIFVKDFYSRLFQCTRMERMCSLWRAVIWNLWIEHFLVVRDKCIHDAICDKLYRLCLHLFDRYSDRSLFKGLFGDICEVIFVCRAGCHVCYWHTSNHCSAVFINDFVSCKVNSELELYRLNLIPWLTIFILYW